MGTRSFQKRHYIAIALVLRASLMRGTLFTAAEVSRIAGLFADTFETDNDRFDRARFLAACGVDDTQSRRNTAA